MEVTDLLKSVPFFKAGKKKQESSPESKVLSESTPFFVKESYKTLRTNLAFSMPNQEHRIVLITSAYVSEGKSTSCLNTAITFAETGAKVCVVDCDLRKPNVARLCAQKGSPGLSNVLAGFQELENVVRKEVYPNLDVLFSGDIPPNPAELLESEAMDTVLHTLAKQYDYVFLDTPPVNVVTDAVPLTAKVDGVLLVVYYQKTTKTELSKAIAQLEFVKAKILGVLLNDIKTEKRSYGKNGGCKYYKHYSHTPKPSVPGVKNHD